MTRRTFSVVGAAVSFLTAGLQESRGYSNAWFSAAGQVNWEVNTNWRTNRAANPTWWRWTPPTAPAATDWVYFTNRTGIVNQPMLNAAQSVLGIDINNAGSGWVFNSGAPGASLTVGSGGLRIQNGNNGAARRTYLYVPAVISGAQTWSVSGGGWGFQNGKSLYVTNPISGSGEITFSGLSTVLYARGSVPHTGGLRFAGGETALYLNRMTAGGSFGLGTGPLTFAGGQLDVCLSIPATAPSDVLCRLTNSLVVTSSGGVCTGSPMSTNKTPKIWFTGPMQLGGALAISSARCYYNTPAGNGFGATNQMTEWKGAITLDHTSTACLVLSEQGDQRGLGVRVCGAVTDGTPHTYKNPLILQGMMNSLQYSSAGSTYSDGTVIDGDATWDYGGTAFDGGVRVDSGCALGVGDVTVLPLGLLQLGSTNSLAVSAGKKIILQSTTNALGLVRIGVDVNAAQILSASSFGSLCLTANNSKINDLSALGNGRMFLAGGTIISDYGTVGAQLTVASLAPCSDGVWRLGGAGPWFARGGTYGSANCGRLDLTQSGVISGGGTLQVGDYRRHGGGYVCFQQAINGFTGKMDLRNAGVIAYARAAGNNTFGDPNGDVDLHNGLLRYYNQPALTSIPRGKKRNVSFEGGYNSLSVWCGSDPGTVVGVNTNILCVESLTRVRRGVLLLDSVGDRFYNSGKNRGVTERILFTNAPPVLGGAKMMPPYMVAYNSYAYNRGGPFWDFAAYNPSLLRGHPIGVDRANSNAWSSLATSTSTDLVVQSAITLTANALAYAIKMNGAVTTNATASPLVTLGNNGYAGILVNGAYNFSPPLNCGTNELIVWTFGDSLFTNKISGSGGLTKAGESILALYSRNNNFTGDITVNRGSLYAQFDRAGGLLGSLGNVNNKIVLNGGYLTAPLCAGYGAYGGIVWPTADRLLASRTLELGPQGGGIGVAVGYYYNVYLYCKMTGPGPFYSNDAAGTIGSMSLWVLNPANDYAGGTWVKPGRTLYAGGEGRLGTGDVVVEGNGVLADDAVGGGGALYLYGAGNIAPTARLWVYRGGIAYAYTNACTVGSIGGTGNIRLGLNSAPTNDTTLIVGGDNSSFDYYGTIYQSASTSPGRGGVTKQGTGTFTLYNDQTFTRNMTVNAGKLMLMGSLASNLVVNASGTVGGMGRVRGNLTINSGGTLAVTLRNATDYDRLTVDRTFTLDGRVDATLAAGYRPTKGTQWTLSTTTVGGSPTTTSPDFTLRRIGSTLVLVYPPRGGLFEIR